MAIKNWVVKKPIATFLIIIAMVFAVYFYFGGNGKPNYEIVIAQKGEIIQEVSVVGRLKAAEDVNLSFEKNGKVAAIYAGKNDKVTAGQILAQLDNTELYAQLAQAQAEFKIQQVKLEELKRGAREEEIKVQEVKTANAKIAVEEAQKNLIEKIQDAYTKSSDAVKNYADRLFTKQGAYPAFGITFESTGIVYSISAPGDNLINEGRQKTEEMFNNWPKEDVNVARNNLFIIQDMLNNIGLVVNAYTATDATANTIYETFKTNISTARANINIAISNLSAAEEKLKTAQSNLTLAEQELILKKSGASSEEIMAQQAQAEKAQANVLNYEAQIAGAIIRSPITGTVTRQNLKVGEIVTAHTPVISAISDAQLEIEADIYEEDIVKIKIGNPVDIKIVAFPQKVFKGKVISINPAEKIINEVVYYEITADFEETPEQIKPGMTADIIIKTASKESALIIPRWAVKKTGGREIVNVFKNGKIEGREVEIGLRGNDFFEILSGLEEGEEIVTAKK